MNPTVIVLASGRGERFQASGGKVHKLHATLGGMGVLERTLSAVRASGLPWHLEDRGHPGMGDSIAAAVLATLPAASQGGWLILPGDLPLVRADTLLRVADAIRQGADICIPTCRGQRGHPVGFAGTFGPALCSLRGDHGAARIMAHAPDGPQPLPVDDPGICMDIDTLDDLARAQTAFDDRTFLKRMTP